jgi:hypothetical protein
VVSNGFDNGAVEMLLFGLVELTFAGKASFSYTLFYGTLN